LSFLRAAQDAGAVTPILILTAHDTVKDRMTGLNAGAEDYLVKLVSFVRCMRRLEM
jgi:DNA-binding response OmpR family regulator